jgi:hypothetical protein
MQSMREADAATVDLDEAMPYAVAMGAQGALKKHLERASGEGYAPAWLGRTGDTWGRDDGGFYPYWVAFHSSVAPSGGGGGGTSSGASAGGGGAGGSF